MSNAHIEFGFVVEPKSKREPILTQVHQSRVLEINSLEHYVEFKKNPPQADGAITTKSGLELYVYTADCLPVLFYSYHEKAPIAAIHCGWRGAKLNIVSKTLKALNVPPQQLNVVLGPAIKSCCFEVKRDLIEAFEREKHYVRPFLTERDGKTFFSLSAFVIETQLKEFETHQINLSSHKCTFCSAPGLPSFRRSGTTDPNIRTWIRKKSKASQF